MVGTQRTRAFLAGFNANDNSICGGRVSTVRMSTGRAVNAVLFI